MVYLDEVRGRLPVSLSQSFNGTRFSRFINSRAGRIFRLAAGAGFLMAGYKRRARPAGWFSMAWSALPLSAGAGDLCYISAALGGPMHGGDIRAVQSSSRPIARGRSWDGLPQRPGRLDRPN